MKSKATKKGAFIQKTSLSLYPQKYRGSRFWRMMFIKNKDDFPQGALNREKVGLLHGIFQIFWLRYQEYALPRLHERQKGEAATG